MMERLFKMVILGAIAGFFGLVVCNNITDYSTNFAFVQHVLLMDTIFPESHLHWRAITAVPLHHLFYWVIITWEAGIAILCGSGVMQLGRQLGADAAGFNAAKRDGVAGLMASCLLWLIPFWAIGGEWFAMWQSPVWNGQPVAFRMFVISAIALIVLRQPDPEL